MVVAKLDRLSRDVHFISGLMKHRVPFIVADSRPSVTAPSPRYAVPSGGAPLTALPIAGWLWLKTSGRMVASPG